MLLRKSDGAERETERESELYTRMEREVDTDDRTGTQDKVYYMKE